MLIWQIFHLLFNWLNYCWNCLNTLILFFYSDLGIRMVLYWNILAFLTSNNHLSEIFLPHYAQGNTHSLFFVLFIVFCVLLYLATQILSVLNSQLPNDRHYLVITFSIWAMQKTHKCGYLIFKSQMQRLLYCNSMQHAGLSSWHLFSQKRLAKNEGWY